MSFVDEPLSIRPLTSNAKCRKSSFFNDYVQKLGSFIRKRSSNPSKVMDLKIISSAQNMPLDVTDKGAFNNHNFSTLGCHQPEDTIRTKYLNITTFIDLPIFYFRISAHLKRRKSNNRGMSNTEIKGKHK